MWGVVWIAIVFVASATIYRFRKPILLRLARFDAKNAQRRAEEMFERRDRFAHYRRAVLTAEESLEEVTSVTIRDERTGEPVKRYLFLGETYLTRNEAETVRRTRAIAIAREFYAELDGTTLPRRPPQEPGPPQAALPEPEPTSTEAVGDRESTPPRPS